MNAKQKVIIIEKLKEIYGNNKFIGFVGESANDAPAMKAADFSISCGIGGTDVAKESSQVVVMDDKLETILEGIKRSNAYKIVFIAGYKLYV